ncbi:MAG: hypothetical protein ACRDVZ_14910 [Jiangellaceae bacterium]
MLRRQVRIVDELSPVGPVRVSIVAMLFSSTPLLVARRHVDYGRVASRSCRPN